MQKGNVLKCVVALAASACLQSCAMGGEQKLFSSIAAAVASGKTS